MSVCTWKRVIIHELLPFYILYTAVLHAHKPDHKYLVEACSPVPPLHWCHKIAGVKFVHSDAHKRTFTQGQLQWDFKKGAMYELVVLQLTPLAAGRHGILTKLCLLTLGWCSRGQMCGLESWPWEIRKISTASLFRCQIVKMNIKRLYGDADVWLSIDSYALMSILGTAHWPSSFQTLQ